MKKKKKRFLEWSVVAGKKRLPEAFTANFLRILSQQSKEIYVDRSPVSTREQDATFYTIQAPSHE